VKSDGGWRQDGGDAEAAGGFLGIFHFYVDSGPLQVVSLLRD